MDPEVAGWLKLLQGGGNVAAIAAVYLAWRVFQRFEQIMEAVVLRLVRIERALIAVNPKTLPIINGADDPAKVPPV